MNEHEILKMAEQSAVGLLWRTGWLKWHDFYISAKDPSDEAELFEIDGMVFTNSHDHFLWLEKRGARKLLAVNVHEREIYGERYITVEYGEEFDHHVENFPVRNYYREWRLWEDLPTEKRAADYPWM